MDERPVFSAAWHALSASMIGWWQRGRRRDMLAAAMRVGMTLTGRG